MVRPDSFSLAGVKGSRSQRSRRMSLPDSIEILPLAHPFPAAITIPGSKSITNRALILGALAGGETTLRGALWSEDTQVMTESLTRLGFRVQVAQDPREAGNRTIQIQGQDGHVPPGGTAAAPLDLFVGNAGTAARFLAALACLGQGIYQLSGVERMHQRPQSGLFHALRQLGYQVEAEADRLPARIHGGGPRGGRAQVSIRESSQFASALLLCAPTGGWEVEVVGHNAEESPYVEMTRQLVTRFPRWGGEFEIEPDASSGSYFVAADHLLAKPGAPPGSLVRVNGWPASDWQVDAAFPRFLPLPKQLSRERDLGDSIMTAMALAPFALRPTLFTDLARLRVQECERVAAMRTELTRCGAQVVEREETLTVYPSPLHGAEIETYQDHRMAMCFAILGLKVPGIKIKNPACVKKTFPNFFQKLAGPPPGGLGGVILQPAGLQALKWEELFAG